MAFEQFLTLSPLTRENISDTIIKQEKISYGSSHCQVCGDKARIINYGILSCQSCKTFFRRNGFHSARGRSCQFNRSCEVNTKTRRTCTACRLAKCLLMGMSPELIRKEDLKIKKCSSSKRSSTTGIVVSKQHMSAPQISILKLIDTDRSSLSNSDWTLLSNIVHAHDTFSITPKIRRTVEELSVSFTESRFGVRNALEIIRSMFISMQSFVRSIPDYQILTLNEQKSLFQRNLYGVVGLYSILMLRDSGLIDSAKCWEPFLIIYGHEMTVNSKRMNQQLDLDSTIVKIMLIVFAFSSNFLVVNTHENMNSDSLLFGTYRLLGSQYVFVELLWKYMIYRYGFYDSVHRFSRLIALLLNLMKYSAIVYTSNATHHDLVDDAVEKAKKTLIVHQNEQIFLWAKNVTYS